MGDIKIKVLNALSLGPLAAADLFCIFLNPYKEMSGEASIRRAEEAFSYNRQIIEDLANRKRFNQLVYLLKKQGIVSVDGKRRRSRVISLTGSGLSLLNKSAENKFPTGEYKVAQATDFKIIAFDIPETERKKRRWLRSVLCSMEFEMIQKSVWAGRVVIPEDFISDLKELNIIDKVEIFTINKLGSLEKLSIK